MAISFHISDGNILLGPFDREEVEYLISKRKLPEISPILEIGREAPRLNSARVCFDDIYRRYHGQSEIVSLVKIASKATAVSARFKPCYWIAKDMEAPAIGPFAEHLLKKLASQGCITGDEKVLLINVNGELECKESLSKLWPDVFPSQSEKTSDPVQSMKSELRIPEKKMVSDDDLGYQIGCVVISVFIGFVIVVISSWFFR